MTTIARRIAAGIVLTAAPTMIALGVAGSADAQTGFPYQGDAPQPGTSVHHHHQNHR